MAVITIERSNFALRPFVVEDAQLLEAETQWPDGRGMPPPTNQLSLGGFELAPPGQDLNPEDILQIRHAVPVLPNLVARLTSLEFFIATSAGNEVVRLNGWSRNASFQANSGDLNNIIPLSLPSTNSVFVSPHNNLPRGALIPDDLIWADLRTQNGELFTLPVLIYGASFPLDTENESIFRDLSRDGRELVFSLQRMGGVTALPEDGIWVRWRASFICWPDSARRLGVLRLAELFHG